MTKQEYIASLTTEQLRDLLGRFSELLIEQDLLDYHTGETTEDDEDFPEEIISEPGFYFPDTRDKWCV